MKRITAGLLALLLLLTMLSGCKSEMVEATFDGETVQYHKGDHLKILDYNIRCTDDGEGKTIFDRSLRFEVIVDKYDPDLIGLQEATHNWIMFLEENLLDTYEMRYMYRAQSSKEATPLLWKKDKFELLDEGYFWLSDTPEVSSKGWGSKYFRICNWVKLKVKATGKEFLFFNTHLTGETTCAINSGNLIIERAKELGGFTDYAVFLTGDFNFAPWSAPYGNLVATFEDFNDALGFDETATNNGYNERDESSSSNSIKDYAMYSPDLVVPLEYKVLNEKILDGYISDHRGVYVEAALL